MLVHVALLAEALQLLRVHAAGRQVPGRVCRLLQLLQLLAVDPGHHVLGVLPGVRALRVPAAAAHVLLREPVWVAFDLPRMVGVAVAVVGVVGEGGGGGGEGGLGHDHVGVGRDHAGHLHVVDAGYHCTGHLLLEQRVGRN